LFTLGGEDILVIQGGTATCSFTLAPSAIAATANATTGAVNVTASDASCGWTATSDASWLTAGTTSSTSAYAQSVFNDQPIGYWPLNEAAGASSAVDASGGGNNGTVGGAVTFGQAGPLADGSTVAG